MPTLTSNEKGHASQISLATLRTSPSGISNTSNGNTYTGLELFSAIVTESEDINDKRHHVSLQPFATDSMVIIIIISMVLIIISMVIIIISIVNIMI